MLRITTSMLACSYFAAFGQALAQPDSGLVAYYAFDGNFKNGASGSTCGVSPLDGIPQGGVGFSAGWNGQAAWFDGVDDWVRVNHTGQLTFDLDVQSYTVSSFVFLLDGVQDACVIQDRYGANVPVSYNIILRDTPGEHRYSTNSWYGFGGGGTGFPLECPAVYMVNNWHHIAVTFDVTTGVKRLFVDGIERGSATRPQQPFHPASPPNTAITIGGYWSSNGIVENHFKGGIDELRIYERALAPLEIRELAERVCRPDINADGALNVADFSAFLQVFAAECR